MYRGLFCLLRLARCYRYLRRNWIFRLICLFKLFHEISLASNIHSKIEHCTKCSDLIEFGTDAAFTRAFAILLYNLYFATFHVRMFNFYAINYIEGDE